MLEDGLGEVQLVGLTELTPESAAHALSLLSAAHSRRSTGSNSVNERSSRSHAVLQFVLRDSSAALTKFGSSAAALAAASAGGAAHNGAGVAVGKFTLVDLAGSERAADTMDANTDSRVEGADINRPALPEGVHPGNG